MNRIALVIIGLLLSCVVCFAQTRYQGLTPGQSTRTDVGRTLGQPIRSVSKTLLEYKSPNEGARLYVQYRDESPAAVVERIELTCPDAACGETSGIFKLGPPPREVAGDVVVLPPDGYQARLPYKYVWYYGAPRFMVYSNLYKVDYSPAQLNFEVRLGFYSKELYESTVPSCAGTILGTWESAELGRLKIVREGDYVWRGTYSKNNGSFTLDQSGRGKWQDDTGSGTINIHAHDDGRIGIVVVWRRTAGTGREMLVEEPPCAKAQGGN